MNAPVRDGQYCEVSPGIRLHYASSGEPGRPLVLFIHGFPEYWGAWRELLPAFADRWYAVAPDLRGFNLSSKPTEISDYKAPALVGDLAGLIRGLGYHRCVVVAHDWGGAVGWALAIGQPDLVERLVIINSPHPYTFWRALNEDAGQQAASQYMNWLRKPGSEQALLADNCAMLQSMLQAGDGAPWLSGATLEEYLAAWQQPGAMRGGVNYYRCSPMYPATDDDPGARRLRLRPEDFVVRVPTLVLWGDRDRALLPALLTGLEQLIPDLRLRRFADGTHWIVHEQPQAIASAIREFIDELSG